MLLPHLPAPPQLPLHSVAAMAHLLDLPNELLSEIIGYRQFDRALLWGLACMNHRLHDVTQPFLVRYATDLSSHQQVLLKRRLEERPDLKREIWSYGPIDTETDGSVSLEDFNAVPELVNLKKLQFRLVKFLPGSLRTKQNLCGWDILYQMKEMELAACKSPRIETPYALILKFAELPSVHTFTMTNILTQLPRSRLPFPKHRWIIPHTYKDIFNFPNLTTLKLNGAENTVLGRRRWNSPMTAFQPAHLRDILHFCTDLTTLHCTDMFLYLKNSTGHSKGQYGKTAVRLEAVCGALVPVEASLQELVLTVEGDENTTFHGRAIDLSTFNSLTKLHISSSFLIQGDEPSSPLHERLPPNLETLRVDFGPTLSGATNHSIVGIDNPEDLFQWRYKWILLFPTEKASRFPRLREIRLVEARPISKNKMVKSELSALVLRAFEEAEIAIEIWVCIHEVEKPKWASIKLNWFEDAL
jgi:hypothetical protein